MRLFGGAKMTNEIPKGTTRKIISEKMLLESTRSNFNEHRRRGSDVELHEIRNAYIRTD